MIVDIISISFMLILTRYTFNEKQKIDNIFFRREEFLHDNRLTPCNSKSPLVLTIEYLLVGVPSVTFPQQLFLQTNIGARCHHRCKP